MTIKKKIRYYFTKSLSGSVSIFLILASLVISLPSYGQVKEKEKLKEKPEVRVGLQLDTFSEMTLKDAEVILNIWMDKIDVGHVYQARAIFYNDFDSVVKALRNKEIEQIILKTTDYLKIENQDLVEALFIPVYGHELAQTYILLVNKNEGINSLQELKDKQLITGVGHGGSEIPLMWLDTELLKAKLAESKSFFNIIKNVNKPSQAILPVFFQQADACITTISAFKTMADLNPQISNELKVLLRSPGFTPMVACFAKHFDEKGKKKITLEALNLHKSLDGQQILTLMQIDRAAPFDPDSLKSIRTLVKSYNDLKGQATNK